MLSKLLKYDILYFFKNIGILYIVYIGIAAVLSLLTLMSDETIKHTYGGIVFITFFCILFILAYAIPILVIADSSRRFKNNLFSDEGYLTHTLPVPSWQLILSKLIASLINMFVAYAAIFTGVMIFSMSKADRIIDLNLSSLSVGWQIELFKENTMAVAIIIACLALLIMTDFLFITIKATFSIKGLGVLANLGIFFALCFILPFFAAVCFGEINADGWIQMLIFTSGILLISAGMFFLTDLLIKKSLNI